MLESAFDLGASYIPKGFISALKYCRVSEEFYRFRLDHMGTHILCPAKMKGQREDKDLRSGGCHLRRDRVSHF